MNENKINAAVRHAVRTAMATGNPAVIAAVVAIAVAVKGRNRPPVDAARDAVAARVMEDARRRNTFRAYVATPEPHRPAHESAALLVNAIDDGHETVERLAAYCDHVAGGVRFADRVDARMTFLAMRDDGTETWRVIADDAVIPADDVPATPRPAWKPRTVRRAAR